MLARSEEELTWSRMLARSEEELTWSRRVQEWVASKL
jgi:hypothetical protein